MENVSKSDKYFEAVVDQFADKPIKESRDEESLICHFQVELSGTFSAFLC